jgi:hypothetical protein
VAATFAYWKVVARQELTLTQARATRAGSPWTAKEDEEILRRNGEPTREVALDLGRSTSAVFARRNRLRRQQERKAAT